MLSQKPNPKSGHHRKNCLLGFIEKCLDNPSLQHLIKWCDESAGLFQVLWVHAGRSSYHKKTHGSLFDLYREYRGRGITSDPKQAFRMALKKSPCIRASLNGSRDWRTFRIIRKCHQICSATEIEQDLSTIPEFAKNINLEETKQILKTQSNEDGIGSVEDDFVTEERCILVKKTANKMKKDDWEFKNNYEINTWNNLFQKYDSELNNNKEVSFLDFLDSLPDASDFHDNMNLKTTPNLSAVEENYTTHCYNLKTSFDQTLDNFLSDYNPPNQNFDFGYPKTLTDLTTSDHNAWTNEPNMQNIFFSKREKLDDNSSTRSTPPNDLFSTPSSCCPSNQYPCRCLHYHVSGREQSVNEILSFDSVGIPSSIFASPSNYSKNDSEKYSGFGSPNYDKHTPPLQMKYNNRTFTDIALEIESTAVDRLLKEGQNCIDAMLHPSNIFYSEQVPRDIPCLDDYSAQAKSEVGNSWISHSYLDQNNTFPNW